MEKKYLNHSEAATYLGVSESALYTWKSSGLIESKKHGRLNFYELEVLDRFGKAPSRKPFTIKDFPSSMDFGTDITSPIKRAGSLTSKYRTEFGHPRKDAG